MTPFEKQALQYLKTIREELHGIHALLAHEYAGEELEPEVRCWHCGGEDVVDDVAFGEAPRVACRTCGKTTLKEQEAVHGC